MAERGYYVIEYDASITRSPYNHHNIKFIKKFVGARDSYNTVSFYSAIKDNRIDAQAHNILQVDIEDCEWDILESIDLELLNTHFSQVIFEFHKCNPHNDDLSKRRLKILKELRRFYTPIHTHFNHCGNACYVINPSNDSSEFGLFWCDCVEVSYLRNDLMPKDFVLKTGLGMLPGLDYSSNMDYPDIPIIFPIQSFRKN